MPRAAPAERPACADAAGTKASMSVVEGELAARLREQMHRRRPAAGQADAVAGEGARARRSCRRRRPAATINAADAPAPAAIRRTVCPASTSMPAARGRSLHRARVVRPHVDDRDRDPRRHQVDRRRVGGRAGGDDRRALARRHAVAVDEGARRSASMMPGRSLSANTSGRSMRAGRQHDLARRAPATAARAAGPGAAWPDGRSGAPPGRGGCGCSSRRRWCAAAA